MEWIDGWKIMHFWLCYASITYHCYPTWNMLLDRVQAQLNYLHNHGDCWTTSWWETVRDLKVFYFSQIAILDNPLPPKSYTAPLTKHHKTVGLN